MSTQLTAFVESCSRSPAVFCAVRQFTQAFLGQIAPAERSAWPRTRIVAEMAKAGYEVGLDRDDRASFIGIGLPLRVVDGRISWENLS